MRGCTVVQLSTETDNQAAHALYEARGFVLQEQRNLIYRLSLPGA